MIKAMNANLQEYKQMDRREFLCFLGIRLLMSTIGSGFNKIDYWSNTLPSIRIEVHVDSMNGYKGITLEI